MKLQSQNLTKKYTNKIAVQNLSITLIPGEILGLLGPNGAGKTTFFYMIAGLINSDSGKILIDGEDVTNKNVSERASMGLAYLPQEPSIFRRLTVEENIMAALGAQTVASSYEQLLHTDTDGGGNGNTLVTIKDGDNGTIFGLKLSTNKKINMNALGLFL